MKDYLGLNHRYFRTLISKIAIVVFCLAWAAFEYTHDNFIWAIIPASIGVYAAFFWLYQALQKNT